MSLPVFANMLAEEDLTLERLERCWNDCNLKNKSPHIDRLMRLLHKKIETSGPIPKDQVDPLFQKYRSSMVKKNIPPTEPQLEDVDGELINPATSIVFEKEDDVYVAVGVTSMGKTYPLQLKHMNVCMSNGWYFRTDNNDISCVYRKN